MLIPGYKYQNIVIPKKSTKTIYLEQYEIS